MKTMNLPEKPKAPYFDKDGDSIESQRYTRENDNQPDCIFSGYRLAYASSQETNGLNNLNYIELEIFITEGGAFVVTKETHRNGDRTTHEAITIPTLKRVYDEMGFSPTAKRAYEQANITAYITIE